MILRKNEFKISFKAVLEEYLIETLLTLERLQTLEEMTIVAMENSMIEADNIDPYVEQGKNIIRSLINKI